MSGDFARLAALEQTTLTTQPKVPSALTSTKSVLHTSDTSSKSASVQRQQRAKQERFSLPSFFVRSPRQGLPRRTPSTRGAKCASPQTRAGARTTGTPADASSIFGIREQAPGLALELIINLAAQSRSSPRRTCLFCSYPPVNWLRASIQCSLCSQKYKMISSCVVQKTHARSALSCAGARNWHVC